MISACMTVSVRELRTAVREWACCLRPMGYSIKFDTVRPGWSIVYIEGLQAIISQKYCIAFSEDQFCLSRQCRP